MAINSLTTHYVQEGSLIGGAGIQFDKFAKNASPLVKVGTRFMDGDGKEYVYSHFGADVNRGVLVATDASESSLVDTDNKVISPASAAVTTDGTIGNKFIQITLASVTADQFSGGVLAITDDVGEGFSYDIVGNNATGDPAANDFRLRIKQPLQVALDNTSDIAIQGSPYANLEIATVTDVILAGVTCQTMDVSAQAFGWVQVKGRVGALQDGAIVIGGVVTLSDSTSGAVQALGGGGTDAVDLIAEPIIGYCAIAGDTGGHGIFMINI